MGVGVVVNGAHLARGPDEQQEVEDARHFAHEVAGVLLGGVCVGIFGPLRGVGDVGPEKRREVGEVGGWGVC